MELEVELVRTASLHDNPMAQHLYAQVLPQELMKRHEDILAGTKRSAPQDHQSQGRFRA